MRLLLMFYWIQIVIGICSCNDSDEIENRNEKQLKEVSEKHVEKKIKITPKSYIDYVNNPKNGLVVSKKVGDIIYSISYRPSSYLTLQQLKISTNFINDTNEFKSSILNFDSFQVYIFRISADNFNEELLKYKNYTPEEYKTRVNYFAFEVQNDLKIVQGNDTLPCILSNFERTFDVTPMLTLNLYFKEKNPGNIDSDNTLLFNDKYFNKLNVSLILHKEDLIKENNLTLL